MHVLVPLDGSPLSEQALAAVKKFANAVGRCSIDLLYVIDLSALPVPGDGVMPTVYLKRSEEWAQGYLKKQSDLLARPGIEVQQLVTAGPPARMILDHLDANAFDYVFMATRGRSGLARTVLGSVTDRVIREAGVPVVAVHPRLTSSADAPWPGAEGATEELIKLLARGDALSVQATLVLADRGAAAVPQLVDALRSNDAEVRQYASRTLGTIGDEQALPALIARFTDEIFEVRWAAAEAVARFREPGVAVVLNALVHGAPDAHRNLAVVHVLERAPIELWPVLEPVDRALRSSESDLTAPIAAAKALRQLRQPATAARA